MKIKSIYFFIIVYSIFVVIPAAILNQGNKFQTGGDSISYLLQAESIYYDRDLIYEKKDIIRFNEKYKKYLSVKNLRIISKQIDKEKSSFAKPIVFSLFISLFTGISDPVLRAATANLLLLFIIYYFVFLIIKNRKFFIIFCILVLFSQMYFYIPIVHPEIFYNFLVIISAAPLFFNSKKAGFYILSSIIGGILIFEKQIAAVFPMTVLVYLFFLNKKKFYQYFITLFISVILILSLNILLHGDALVYQGLRGASVFDGKNINFTSRGKIEPFTFPMSYWHRFKEYFFGKNIGIFVYNTAFLLLPFLIFFNKKKVNTVKFIFSLPIFLYLLIYFIAVDPLYSYGGSTSIGNRYFFQIYIYVLLVICNLLKEIREKSALKTFIFFVLILCILFSAKIYYPFYKNYSRATQDHLKTVFQNKVFNFLPIELAYAEVIYQDLSEKDKIGKNIFFLRNSNEIIEISATKNFSVLNKFKKAKLIYSYELNYLLKKKYYLGLFKYML